MSVNDPIVIELKNRIETKFGKRPQTSNDFDELSSLISTVSATTLKRLWGYIDNPNKLRVSTLDMLAKYVCFKSFQDFCVHLNYTNQSSGFFTTKLIYSKSLKFADLVEIGWAPSRYVVLKYLGGNRFKVEDSINSKLNVGDILETSCLMLLQPICTPYVIRNGEKLPPFIAAKDHGLTIINKL